MRTFIAINLTTQIKNYLHTLQAEFKNAGCTGNYSAYANFHLTLHFIGETDNGVLHSLKKAVTETARQHKNMTLTTGRAGYFSKGNRYILWCGLTDEAPIRNLADTLTRELQKQGVPLQPEQFVPHLTLGRNIIIPGDPSALFASLAKTEPHSMQVAHIEIMESTRKEGELVYLPIFSAPFNS